MLTDAPIQDARLADLRAGAARTAATHVPLVLYHDVVEGGWQSRIRHVDFNSLYLAERGSGLHVIDSTPYAISRGDVYVMAAGSHHAFVSGHKLLLHAIHFSPAMYDAATWDALGGIPGFGMLRVESPAAHRLHLSPPSYAQIVSDLAEIRTEWGSCGPASALLVPALFLRLLVRLARFASGEQSPTISRPTPIRHHAEIVAEAVRTIDEGYSSRLRVADLAASAYLSPDRFTQVFAAVMGQTPRDYVRHVRLERAKTLLSGTTMPISGVARAAGFPDNAHFSRVFRASAGMTPRDYRRSGRPAADD